MLANLFNSNKFKKTNDQHEQDQIKKENCHSKYNDEDLPPVVIPRRLSLSKSGRLKEKKRTKLNLSNISRNEITDNENTQKIENNSNPSGKDNLEKFSKANLGKTEQSQLV